MRHVYIAGPMRAFRGFNFPAFFEAERRMREQFPDADICNPAREDVVRHNLHDSLKVDPTGMTAGLYLQDGDHPFTAEDLRDALGVDLAYITSTADLLVMLPGWRESKGALAEVATANALGIEVVELPEDDEALIGQPHARGNAPFPSAEKAQEAAQRDPAVEMWQEAGEGLFVAPVGTPAPQASLDGYEVREVSASGGEKGAKPAQFDQIPPDALWRLAEHFGKGARKYDAHNFRKGYRWSLSYNAALRHALDFWAGRDWDVCPEDGRGCLHRPEDGDYPMTENGPTCFNHTGSHHLDAFMWHAVVLRTFYDEHKEYDDRYVHS